MNTYCINLKNRRNKWVKVQKEAVKLDIKLIRFDAIFNTHGHTGCFLSHTTLLSQVKDEGVFMIIEDDIKVLEPLETLDKAIKQLPDDWDMLYLGATPKKKLKRYSDNLFILSGVLCTHAVIYNNQNGIVDYILDNARGIIDAYYRDNIHDKFNCYITYPIVCCQASGFSDTTRWWKEEGHMEEKYKLYTR